MRLTFLAGVVTPCCLLAACGSSGPTAGSLSGHSPDEVLALSTRAITNSHSSFHFIDVSRLGSKVTTLTGDATTTGADQSLSGSASALVVERRAGGQIFVRGASQAIEGALGFTAAVAKANAGKWIAVDSGDSPYKALEAALAAKQELGAFVPTGKLALQAPRQFHNRTVVGVSGRAPSSAAEGSGEVATIYVPTEPPYTPVGATLTFNNGSGTGVEAVVFDHWGQPIDPPAPKNATTFSSLS